MRSNARLLGLFAGVAALLTSAAPAQYIGGDTPPPPAARLPGVSESSGEALARFVRVLAANPQSYEALLGAGKASLAIGDAEAAIGFYARAEEISPRSWVPRVGQGAALAQLMDPASAMRAFDEALRLGASQAAVALDRGLAFDLSGDQARAQADYRIALAGLDRDEARRRFALSLAISGRRAEALTMLDPLLARRDKGAARARAFVLALTGDPEGARNAVNAALPGMAGSMDPFLRRLPVLRPAEKAAAVHFGVMPGSGTNYATANADPQGDRLGEIDRFLRAPEPSAGPLPAAPPPAPVRVAVNLPPRASAATAPRRIWLQLASGRDPASLPMEYRRLAARGRELLKGLSPWIAEEPGKVRLLIGPFKSTSDAAIFAEDLAAVDVDSMSWTSRAGQSVRKIDPR